MKKQWFFLSLIGMAFSIMLSSCDSGSSSSGDDDSDGNQQIRGTLVNVTGQPIVGATVEGYKSVSGRDKAGDQPDFTSTTNEMGVFMAAGVQAGTYQLSIYAPGYIDTTITYSTGSELELEITITGAANISGTIINSQTGDGLPNVTIAFSTNDTLTNADNGDLIVTTDSVGNYEIEGAPVGTFRVIIDAPGNFIRILDDVEVVQGETEMDDITSVTPPDEGSLRIILTWGVAPSDLDSHFTGPDESGERFHVYFSDEVSYDGNVDLDVDDVTSYGPETITIHTFLEGTYRYSVHNYSIDDNTGAQSIANSPARVEVFDSEGLVQAFTPPSATDGNTWVVFEINVSGSTAQIVPVNTYTYVNDESYITKK